MWRVFLLYPLGIVPFTYATSFLFTSDHVAQTVTIFLHFAFGGIGAITTFILRCIDSTFTVGDRLHNWLKIIPSFCLTNSIMFSSSKDRLYSVRPDLRADDLDLSLIGGDMLGLGMHCVGWCLVLIAIEAGAFTWLGKTLILMSKNRIEPKEGLELDEDVRAEEVRVG